MKSTHSAQYREEQVVQTIDGAISAAWKLIETKIESIIRSPHESLTAIEWSVLEALYEKDKQRASALAKRAGRAQTSFTPTLDRLWQKGYIIRQADPHDRRAVNICLTKQGKVRKKRTQAERELLDAFIKEALTEDEIAQLTSLLSKLTQR